MSDIENEVPEEEVDSTQLPLKLDKRDINQETPWQDDVLDREKTGTALLNLVKCETKPLVVTLNGTWGSGKTFFLKRWKVQLRQAELHSIYFNAWEDDYCVDPLVAIVGQLRDSLSNNVYQAHLQTVVSAAKKVAKRSILNSVSAATGGVIEIDEGDFKSERHTLFDEYEEAKRSRESPRKALEKLTREVQKNSSGPLVFIIDELDRCRPTFAIELLERVKHLFGITNMVFVLGIDRGQLGSSVKSVYGDIDVDGYFRRFFDMEFSLGRPDKESFCKFLLKEHGLESHAAKLDSQAQGAQNHKAYTHVESILSFLTKEMDLSLRDIESLVRSYVFTSRNMNDSQKTWPELLSILLVLRSSNKTLYEDIIQSKAEAKRVLDYIEGHYKSPHSESSMDEYHKKNLIAASIYHSIAKSGRERKNALAALDDFFQNGLKYDPSPFLSMRTIILETDAQRNLQSIHSAIANESIRFSSALGRSIERLCMLIEL